MFIEFYRKANGEVPISEFIDSLPSKLATKTKVSIDMLREYGYLLRMPFVEKISDDIWELRTKESSNITRVFYFFYEKDKAVLTHGFIKKTNKLPANEIEKAKKYREDYYRRKANETY